MEKVDKSLKSKAIQIQGKDYVMVAARIVFFNEQYPNGSITTSYTEEDTRVTFKAVIVPDCSKPERVFNAYSQAVWGVGMVNKTSALENAETSAVGRALAMMGIGVIDSVASVDEVNKAKQTEAVQNNLGNCDKCHAPKIMSKKGTAYCSAKCWLAPSPKREYTEDEKAFSESLDSIPVIN